MWTYLLVMFLAACGASSTTMSPSDGSSDTASDSAADSDGAPSSTLPARLVGGWHWQFDGYATLAMLAAHAPQYDYLAWTVAQSAQSGSGRVYFSKVTSDTQVMADIAAWKAAGKVATFLIGGEGDGGIRLLDATHEQEMFDTLVPIIDKFGFQGIEWDLESGAAAWSPQSMANVSARLKEHYGTGFIIAMDPRPFEVRSGGIYRDAIERMGANVDLIVPQFYALNGDSVAAQASYMDADLADFTVNVAPQSKWVIGCVDPQEGESIATDVGTWQRYVELYPALRGAMLWTTMGDAATGWQFAQQMGAAVH